MKRSPNFSVKRTAKTPESTRLTYWDLPAGSYFISFGNGKNLWYVIKRSESRMTIRRDRDGLERNIHPCDLLEMVNKNVKENMHLIEGV